MEKIQKSCGFQFGIDVDLIGSRVGLSLAWRGNVSIMLQSFSNHHIDVIIEEGGDDKKWRFTGFYGSPYSHDTHMIGTNHGVCETITKSWRIPMAGLWGF